MAKKHGWKLTAHQANIGMVSFSKTIDELPARINIYTSTMTVATSLTHPKQGKTQLYRKHVDKILMIDIFKNPRVHTNAGYQRKRK